ncbi:MAG: cytochrome C biogenesis protein, partial [Cyanobacteria bacterium P01_D01_bin.105]
MKTIKFTIGLFLGLLLIILPLSQLQQSSSQSSQSSLAPLETLVVQQAGRKKPLSTVAQETVAKIHGSTSYKHDGRAESAMETFLSLWLNNRNWNEEPFVLFSYRPLKETVGLDPDQKYFSFETLMRNQGLGEAVRAAHQQELADEDVSRDGREAIAIEDRLSLMLGAVSD